MNIGTNIGLFLQNGDSCSKWRGIAKKGKRRDVGFFSLTEKTEDKEKPTPYMPSFDKHTKKDKKPESSIQSEQNPKGSSTSSNQKHNARSHSPSEDKKIPQKSKSGNIQSLSGKKSHTAKPEKKNSSELSKEKDKSCRSERRNSIDLSKDKEKSIDLLKDKEKSISKSDTRISNDATKKKDQQPKPKEDASSKEEKDVLKSDRSSSLRSSTDNESASKYKKSKSSSSVKEEELKSKLRNSSSSSKEKVEDSKFRSNKSSSSSSKEKEISSKSRDETKSLDKNKSKSSKCNDALISSKKSNKTGSDLVSSEKPSAKNKTSESEVQSTEKNVSSKKTRTAASMSSLGSVVLLAEGDNSLKTLNSSNYSESVHENEKKRSAKDSRERDSLEFVVVGSEDELSSSQLQDPLDLTNFITPLSKDDEAQDTTDSLEFVDSVVTSKDKNFEETKNSNSAQSSISSTLSSSKSSDPHNSDVLLQEDDLDGDGSNFVSSSLEPIFSELSSNVNSEKSVSLESPSNPSSSRLEKWESIFKDDEDSTINTKSKGSTSSSIEEDDKKDALPKRKKLRCGFMRPSNWKKEGKHLRKKQCNKEEKETKISSRNQSPPIEANKSCDADVTKKSSNCDILRNTTNEELASIAMDSKKSDCSNKKQSRSNIDHEDQPHKVPSSNKLDTRKISLRASKHLSKQGGKSLKKTGSKNTRTTFVSNPRKYKSLTVICKPSRREVITLPFVWKPKDKMSSFFNEYVPSKSSLDEATEGKSKDTTKSISAKPKKGVKATKLDFETPKGPKQELKKTIQVTDLEETGQTDRKQTIIRERSSTPVHNKSINNNDKYENKLVNNGSTNNKTCNNVSKSEGAEISEGKPSNKLFSDATSAAADSVVTVDTPVTPKKLKLDRKSFSEKQKCCSTPSHSCTEKTASSETKTALIVDKLPTDKQISTSDKTDDLISKDPLTSDQTSDPIDEQASPKGKQSPSGPKDSISCKKAYVKLETLNPQLPECVGTKSENLESSSSKEKLEESDEDIAPTRVLRSRGSVDSTHKSEVSPDDKEMDNNCPAKINPEKDFIKPDSESSKKYSGTKRDQPDIKKTDSSNAFKSSQKSKEMESSIKINKLSDDDSGASCKSDAPKSSSSSDQQSSNLEGDSILSSRPKRQPKASQKLRESVESGSLGLMSMSKIIIDQMEANSKKIKSSVDKVLEKTDSSQSSESEETTKENSLSKASGNLESKVTKVLQVSMIKVQHGSSVQGKNDSSSSKAKSKPSTVNSTESEKAPKINKTSKRSLEGDEHELNSNKPKKFKSQDDKQNSKLICCNQKFGSQSELHTHMAKVAASGNTFHQNRLLKSDYVQCKMCPTWIRKSLVPIHMQNNHNIEQVTKNTTKIQLETVVINMKKQRVTSEDAFGAASEGLIDSLKGDKENSVSSKIKNKDKASVVPKSATKIDKENTPSSKVNSDKPSTKSESSSSGKKGALKGILLNKSGSSKTPTCSKKSVTLKSPKKALRIESSTDSDFSVQDSDASTDSSSENRQSLARKKKRRYSGNIDNFDDEDDYCPDLKGESEKLPLSERTFSDSIENNRGKNQVRSKLRNRKPPKVAEETKADVQSSRKKKPFAVRSDSSDSNHSSSESSSDDLDSSSSDSSDDKENTPTVELNMFSYPSTNNGLTLFLSDPKNAKLKIYANMDSIFVSDVSLGDGKKQQSYLTENNNIIYVNSKHNVFPDPKHLKDHIPQPVIIMKTTKLVNAEKTAPIRGVLKDSNSSNTNAAKPNVAEILAKLLRKSSLQRNVLGSNNASVKSSPEAPISDEPVQKDAKEVEGSSKTSGSTEKLLQAIDAAIHGSKVPDAKGDATCESSAETSKNETTSLTDEQNKDLLAHIVDSTLYGFDDDDELPDIEGDLTSDVFDINTINPSFSGMEKSSSLTNQNSSVITTDIPNLNVNADVESALDTEVQNEVVAADTASDAVLEGIPCDDVSSDDQNEVIADDDTNDVPNEIVASETTPLTVATDESPIISTDAMDQEEVFEVVYSPTLTAEEGNHSAKTSTSPIKSSTERASNDDNLCSELINMETFEPLSSSDAIPENLENIKNSSIIESSDFSSLSMPAVVQAHSTPSTSIKPKQKIFEPIDSKETRLSFVKPASPEKSAWSYLDDDSDEFLSTLEFTDTLHSPSRLDSSDGNDSCDVPPPFPNSPKSNNYAPKIPSNLIIDTPIAKSAGNDSPSSEPIEASEIQFYESPNRRSARLTPLKPKSAGKQIRTEGAVENVHPSPANRKESLHKKVLQQSPRHLQNVTLSPVAPELTPVKVLPAASPTFISPPSRKRFVDFDDTDGSTPPRNYSALTYSCLSDNDIFGLWPGSPAKYDTPTLPNSPPPPPLLPPVKSKSKNDKRIKKATKFTKNSQKDSYSKCQSPDSIDSVLQQTKAEVTFETSVKTSENVFSKSDVILSPKDVSSSRESPVKEVDCSKTQFNTSVEENKTNETSVKESTVIETPVREPTPHRVSPVKDSDNRESQKDLKSQDNTAETQHSNSHTEEDLTSPYKHTRRKSKLDSSNDEIMFNTIDQIPKLKLAISFDDGSNPLELSLDSFKRQAFKESEKNSHSPNPPGREEISPSPHKTASPLPSFPPFACDSDYDLGCLSDFEQKSVKPDERVKKRSKHKKSKSKRKRERSLASDQQNDGDDHSLKIKINLKGMTSEVVSPPETKKSKKSKKRKYRDSDDQPQRSSKRSRVPSMNCIESLISSELENSKSLGPDVPVIVNPPRETVTPRIGLEKENLSLKHDPLQNQDNNFDSEPSKSSKSISSLADNKDDADTSPSSQENEPSSDIISPLRVRHERNAKLKATVLMQDRQFGISDSSVMDEALHANSITNPVINTKNPLNLTIDSDEVPENVHPSSSTQSPSAQLNVSGSRRLSPFKPRNFTDILLASPEREEDGYDLPSAANPFSQQEEKANVIPEESAKLDADDRVLSLRNAKAKARVMISDQQCVGLKLSSDSAPKSSEDFPANDIRNFFKPKKSASSSSNTPKQQSAHSNKYLRKGDIRSFLLPKPPGGQNSGRQTSGGQISGRRNDESEELSEDVPVETLKLFYDSRCSSVLSDGALPECPADFPGFHSVLSSVAKIRTLRHQVSRLNMSNWSRPHAFPVPIDFLFDIDDFALNRAIHDNQ